VSAIQVQHAFPWANSPTDMRKPMSKDVHKRSIRANGRDMIVSPQEVS
jgi:hypothetical protein